MTMRKKGIVRQIPVLTCGKPRNVRLRLRMSFEVIKQVRECRMCGLTACAAGSHFPFVPCGWIECGNCVDSNLYWITFAGPILIGTIPMFALTLAQKEGRNNFILAQKMLAKITYSNTVAKRCSKSFFFLFISFSIVSRAFVAFPSLCVNTRRSENVQILCNEM